MPQEINQQVTSAATIFTLDTYGPTPYSPLRWANIELLAPVAWAGVTVVFEGTNNFADTNWNAWQLVPSSAINSGPVSSTTSPGVFTGPIPYRWVRARVPGYTSGTVQAIADFFELPAQLLNVLQTIIGSSATILNLPSAARASYTAQFTGLGGYTELAIDFNVTALTGGTTPTVTFKVSRIGADSNIYQLEQAAGISAAGPISYNIGAGLDNKSFGDGIQVDMVLTGAPTSITFSASIKAKI